MTDTQIGTGAAQAPAAPAPVEQQSTETVIEQPKSPAAQRRAEAQLPSSTETVVETKPAEPAKAAEPTEADKANQAAREALQNRMRAEDAERRLKEMTPKAEVSDTKPDINDQKTWGKKYQDKPNDLETFLQARDEWVEAQSEKKFTDRQKQESAAQAMQKQRVEIAERDNTARKKFTDYDAVINPIIPIIASSPILKDFVTRNPMGSEVAYELGRNPAVLQALLSNADVWSIGEQLINMATRLKASKPVQVTQAPDPITPVGSRETARTNLLQLAAKDDGSYFNEMNKRERKAKFGRAN